MALEPDPSPADAATDSAEPMSPSPREAEDSAPPSTRPRDTAAAGNGDSAAVDDVDAGSSMAPHAGEPATMPPAGAAPGMVVDAGTPPPPAAGSGAQEEDASIGPTVPEVPPPPTEPQPPPIAPRTDGCPEDAPLPVDRVRVLAAPAQAEPIAGARIQGSNSGPTTDFVDLATIADSPAPGTFADVRFTNAVRYRYIRYYAARGSQSGVAEVEFYSGGRRLAGDAFGTAIGAVQTSFASALDGDPTTYFSPTAVGGGYVGLDIARGYVTQPPVFNPAGSALPRPTDVSLSSATAAAAIRYTDDGSDPTGAQGAAYTGAITLSEGRTTLRAVASAACRFDSSIASETYVVGSTTEPVGRGLRTYHIGNSLTDTINPWLKPIADSTGVTHDYARWTIPGAPIKWLAEHEGQGFEDPQGASRFDSFVASFAPIDHLSIQPYSDPSFESQGGAAVDLLSTALRYSPDIQFWIYAQWPGRTEWTSDAFSVGGGSVYPEWTVPRAPTTWEEGTRNELLYHEAFRDYVDARVGGKPLLIVPGGLALVELKRRMEAGLIPGLGGPFFDSMFEDEAHLKAPAQYLISLVFYSCLYRQSPEGRVTSSGTGLTAEQARIFQQIAWQVASEYPGSGL